MGRGIRNKDDKQQGAASARRSIRSPEEQQLADFERVVMPLSIRFLNAGRDKETREEQNAAKARAVRKLPIETQRKLIECAQECERITEANPEAAIGGQAKNLGERAREVFIYSHTGFVMQNIRRHFGAFESEDDRGAQDVLSQEAYLGLHDAVNKFELGYQDSQGDVRSTESDPATMASTLAIDRIKARRSGAKHNPLTFASSRVRHRVSEAKEQGPLITAKSRAFDDRQKVQASMKAIQSRGDGVTAAEIAEKTGVEESRVSQLLGTLTSKARLDQPMSAEGDAADTLGSVIADQTTNIEASVISDSTRETVRDAANNLKPFQRRVVELHFNLSGGEDVEQKDLYDGCYVDPNSGERYSSEGTVISDRAKRDINVAKASQKDLNQRFEKGELVFEAGTPESFDLAKLKGQAAGSRSPSRDEALGRVITRETGVPMTSGQIQDAKDQALYELSQQPTLQDLRPRYRGNHELENSLQARTFVRRALEMLGDVEAGKGDSVKAGRAARDGSHKRGALGEKASERGWLSTETGRVDWGRLREDVRKHKLAQARAARSPNLESTEELADIMANA